MAYRTKKSYLGKTLESELKQLGNLRQNKTRGKGKLGPAVLDKLEQADIIEFSESKDFLGLSFEKRPAQKVVLKKIYGIKLTEEELKIYQKLTTNKEEFQAGIELEEACLVAGARGGKSLISSIISCYEATRQKWQKYLNKGESGYAVIVSTRQKLCEQVIQSNCYRLMSNSPTLKFLIKDSTQSELSLKNNMKIVSSPCTNYSYRGVPIINLVADEIGHFFTQGPKADFEILNALMPRMSQFPGAKLILISTPSAKQGALWVYYEQGFKVPGRLTIQAESIYMNPLVNKAFLAKEMKRDIDLYNREYLAIFAEQVEAFLSYNLIVNSLKLAGDLAYNSKYQYFCGIDASGLSGRDKFALAVTHKKDNDIYCDKVKTWDLKDPDPIMEDIKKICGIFNIRRISIDRYAKGWVTSALQKIGLEVVIRPTLAEVYVNLKSLMIGDRLFLPDNAGLKKAFLNCQAFYGKNNALSIAHERNEEGHSDNADAICGAVFEATGEETGPIQVRWITDRPKPEIPGFFDDDDDNNFDGSIPESYGRIGR